MKLKKIAILILVFNKLKETIECINSFLPSNQAIYVLNNGSDETIWRMIEENYRSNPNVTFFSSPINLGVSGGRNFLINNTEEPLLLMVDNDITIRNPTTWYSHFQSIFSEEVAFDAYSLNIFNKHENCFSKPVNLVKIANKVSIETSEDLITNSFPGGGSIVRREVFLERGLFDESLFVGFEDFEYALRSMLSPQGQLKVLRINSIELIHDHRVQKTKADKESVKVRYNENKIRNSYDSIVNKYHIEFDHSWEWWTKNQIADMNGKSFARKIKEKVSTFFKS